MDSSRLRSRVTQEEERAGYGGATAQARTIEIKNTFFFFFLNVHTPGKIHKDTELERPTEDGETTEEVKEKGDYGY